MATFVLVHGSHGGGWIWKKVAALLRAGGHEVYAPTLTGVSDRAHLLECGVDLNTHITDVANLLIYEDLSDVVLVGNSYGGMVITGVAATVPERLRQVIYLDAYLPDAGQKEVDLWPPEMRAGIESDAAAEKGLRQPPAPQTFGVTDPDLVEWVKTHWTPHPLATYRQPVPAGDARTAALPKAYIRCTAWTGGISPAFEPFLPKARALGWQVRELAAGHIAMVTHPQEVADLLLELAGEK